MGVDTGRKAQARALGVFEAAGPLLCEKLLGAARSPRDVPPPGFSSAESGFLRPVFTSQDSLVMLLLLLLVLGDSILSLKRVLSGICFVL